MNDGMWTGVFFASAILVVKLIEHMLSKSKEKELDEVVKKIETLETTLTSILAVCNETLGMHQRYDDDGLPLWYVPRSWQTVQEKILEVLGMQIDSIKDVARGLEKVDDKINRIKQQ